MITFIITMYIIPFIVVLIGTGPWVKKNQGLGIPMLLVALLPAVNIVVAGVTVIIRLYSAIARKPI